MRKVLIPFCLFICAVASAQIKEGKVVYERTMERRQQGRDEAANTTPQTRKDKFEVLFGNNQSIWKILPGVEGDNNANTSQGTRLRMTNNNDVIYFNFSTGKRLDQREMLEREFLVDDSIPKLNWKLSEETKTILGHTARKATAQRIGTRTQRTMENGQARREQVPDTSNIVAWFTTDVTVPAGPQEFQGQLPGLILELSTNNGRTVYTATELSPKVDLSQIKEPKEGKRLTAAEFALERDKLMEEMRRNNPRGN